MYSLSVLFSNILWTRQSRLAGLKDAWIPPLFASQLWVYTDEASPSFVLGSPTQSLEPVSSSLNQGSCPGGGILETPSPGLDSSLACVSSDFLARVRSRFHQEDWTKTFSCGVWDWTWQDKTGQIWLGEGTHAPLCSHPQGPLYPLLSLYDLGCFLIASLSFVF